ncbi:uncharacterized protein LOC143049154 [Mytilus galloprovincialis]|uniref:uncharacterized protein LOC143049154 n=1 Tax=Mytilus galloprovincialis TaxID=29158 RepID=UPI003F7B7502
MAEMTKAEPNIYVNNIFDNVNTTDDAMYEKCFDTEDQSNYDHLSPVSKERPPETVFTFANKIPTDQSIQQDNCLSKEIQIPWRLLVFISCFLVTIVVSNVATFVTTKNKFSEKKTQHIMCSSSPCLHGGVCVNDDEHYYCSCTRGFSGTNCEVTPCTGLNCLNEGSCDVLNGTFHCICSSGFSGQLCEELGPCISNSCFNNGSCTVSENSYNCSCPSGTHGSRCQGLFHETITSPGYPLNYDNSMDIVWKIDVGFRNTILLRFTDFILEKDYDFVKIYNGPSTSYCLVAELTGRTLPVEVSVMGRYLTITFTSDSFLTYQGFRAVIYKIPSE